MHSWPSPISTTTTCVSRHIVRHFLSSLVVSGRDRACANNASLPVADNVDSLSLSKQIDRCRAAVARCVGAAALNEFVCVKLSAMNVNCATDWYQHQGCSGTPRHAVLTSVAVFIAGASTKPLILSSSEIIVVGVRDIANEGFSFSF